MKAITAELLEEIYRRNIDTVYKVCYMYMKNKADSEDAAEDAFVRLYENGKLFENAEHEKAWLIRVASNICKNMLKRAGRHNEDIDELSIPDANDEESRDVVREVSALPELYRIPVYLFYFEGYNTGEIAAITKRSPSAVRSQLMRGRDLLKKALGRNQDE